MVMLFIWFFHGVQLPIIMISQINGGESCQLSLACLMFREKLYNFKIRGGYCQQNMMWLVLQSSLMFYKLQN